MPAPTAMLAATGREWPTDSGWVMQPKWDGFRLLVRVGPRGRIQAWSRHATELTDRLGDLFTPLQALPAGTVLDGELVCLAERDGRVVQDFAGVGQAALRRDAGAARRLHFVAFDVLTLGALSTARLPLQERLEHLANTMPQTQRVRHAPAQPADLSAHERVIALGFEGSVLKRARSIYLPGRHGTWRKHKARHHIAATVLRTLTSRDGRPYAVCQRDDDGQPVTAAVIAARPDIGDRVEVVYSRIDANGSLREARLAAPVRLAIDAGR